MDPEIISKEKKVESNQTGSQVDLNNIKSKYILKIIFDMLGKKESLNIIKYSKRMQKKLNYNNNDYKEYSQTFSPIEIELIPLKNEYGAFINIEENESNYHIYFNDEKKETKRTYLNKYEKVSKIRIIIDFQVKSFYKLFCGCKCIESIYFKKFFRNNIIDMSYLFSECISLKYLDLSHFNTDNVTDMKFMFSWCSLLQELNLSNFNTTKVTDMYAMFFKCSSLKELNISNLDTSNVLSMNSMFAECSSLKELNLSNFITNNLNDMGGMFCECSSLVQLNISNFTTNKVTNMNNLFYGCSSLNELDLSCFNIDNLIKMTDMFYNCSEKLKTKIKSQNKKIAEKVLK